jgi:hypothetical protein
MTEAEWLACTDPVRMLIHLGKRTKQGRKARLFAVACCRRIWHLMVDPRSQGAVLMSEQYADRLEKKDTLTEVAGKAWQAIRELLTSQSSPSQAQAADAAWRTAGLNYVRMGAASALQAVESRTEEAAVQATLLRCIFGNPFRPVALKPAWLAWQGGTIPKLAQGIYEERALPSGELDTARLAVLADALEEAGCDNTDILNHCRQPGPHVRGCWVLDLILGME